MRFSKVLPPELFRGTRGSKTAVDLIRTGLSLFVEDERGLKLEADENDPKSNLVFDAISGDIAVGTFFKLGRDHLKRKANSYHICRDFLLALHQIPDRDLNVAYLPMDFTAYVSLPKDVVLDADGDPVSGFYVNICVADKGMGFNPSLYGKRIISFSYQSGEHDEAIFNGLGYFTHELVDNENVAEMCSKYPMGYFYNGISIPTKHNSKQVSMLKTFFNIILYINSSDPELLRLVPTHGKSLSQKNKVAVKGHINECTIPVIAINWDYKLNENDYVDGSVSVRTHPRWQPCGTGFSQVKLIWVKEHQRTMKLRVKGDENEEG